MNPAPFLALSVLLAGSSILDTETIRGSILDCKGTALAETMDGQRAYPQKKQAAHLSGYVNAGGTGLEKSLDETLTQGNDVTLTIDLRIQNITADIFPEDKEGSIVVVNPNSGAILALASFPAFDPNDYSPENYNQFLNDPRKPLSNRALESANPGSVYKILTALAAGLAEFEDSPLTCNGGVQFGNKFIKCWIEALPEKRHGSLDLSTAIKHSCNAYFYQMSNIIGIDSIEKTAKLLGLTKATGCGLEEESPGMLGTPALLKEQGLRWSDAYTAITSVGQGFTEATPLQLASMTASVANGGKVFQPHLVRRDQPELKTDLTKNGIPAKHIELVRRAMWRVVHEPGGTGSNAKTEAVEIAGKTGTAQTGNPNRPTNAWFVGFAPYENPKLAICVLVENGKGGNHSAAPIAREVLTRSLTLIEK